MFPTPLLFVFLPNVWSRPLLGISLISGHTLCCAENKIKLSLKFSWKLGKKKIKISPFIPEVIFWWFRVKWSNGWVGLKAAEDKRGSRVGAAVKTFLSIGSVLLYHLHCVVWMQKRITGGWRGLKRALTPFDTYPCILYYSDSGVVHSSLQFRSKLLWITPLR